MTLDLYMIGLIVEDMDQSLEFYRRLGVAIPEGSEGKTHVEVKMGSGLTFFLDSKPYRFDPGYPRTSETEPKLPSDRYPFLLEFFLQDRAVMEARYNELIGYGYQSRRAPYETPFGMVFAWVSDPDGNAILLSAETGH